MESILFELARIWLFNLREWKIPAMSSITYS